MIGTERRAGRCAWIALSAWCAITSGCALWQEPARPVASEVPPRTTQTVADSEQPAALDQAVVLTQANSTELNRPTESDTPAALPIPNPTAVPVAEGVPSTVPGQSIGLDLALQGALTGNPDLLAIRQNAPATWEAVEVARRFPVTLNPTLWLNVRPFNFQPKAGGGWKSLEGWINTSIRQPLEFGHQTTHRHAIAMAAYNQSRGAILQAEVLAIVQTYRFFQTSAYRREKLRLAEQLVAFNTKLVASLRKASEENLVAVADVRIAEVELSALKQQAAVARQDYAIALADLRNQIGVPDIASTAEPLGEFVLPDYIPPLEDRQLEQVALQSRPEIFVARAALDGAAAAVRLAKGDRIPTIVAGPEYQRDEVGIQYFGFVMAAPLPTLNNGQPLVRQREAEYRRFAVALEQVQQRTVAQVRVAVAKWNASEELVRMTRQATQELERQVSDLETLFQENRIDLTKLLQARQRLIQLENSRLDATWQATQAQADLLTAMGAPNLLQMTQVPANQPRDPARAMAK